METVIASTIASLAPLLLEAIAAKNAGDAARHDAILKQFNERVVAAYAAANGLSAELASSDAQFHADLRALAAKYGPPSPATIAEAAAAAADGFEDSHTPPDADLPKLVPGSSDR